QVSERFRETARIVVCPDSLGFFFAFRLPFPYGLSDTSRSIGEAVADDAFNFAFGALHIVTPARNSVGVPAIELRKIAVEVFFLTVLVDALHAALENREIAFGGIGSDAPAHVFFAAVIYGFVAGKLTADFLIGGPFVGHQVGLALNVLA